MSLSLTPQQAKCLIFLQVYMRESDGIAPSFEEIMKALCLSSKSGVHRLLTGLEERGRIRRIYGHARALEIIGPLKKGDVPKRPDQRKTMVDDLRAVADRIEAMQ